MTGGKFVTNDNVDVRDRTRLERDAVPVVETVTEGEPGGEDGGCSLLVGNDGNDRGQMRLRRRSMGMAKSVMDQIQDGDVSGMDRDVVMNPAGEGRSVRGKIGFSGIGDR